MEIQEFLNKFFKNAEISCINYCSTTELAPCWVKHVKENYLEQDLTKCKLMKDIDFCSINQKVIELENKTK